MWRRQWEGASPELVEAARKVKLDNAPKVRRLRRSAPRGARDRSAASDGSYAVHADHQGSGGICAGTTEGHEQGCSRAAARGVQADRHPMTRCASARRVASPLPRSRAPTPRRAPSRRPLSGREMWFVHHEGHVKPVRCKSCTNYNALTPRRHPFSLVAGWQASRRECQRQRAALPASPASPASLPPLTRVHVTNAPKKLCIHARRGSPAANIAARRGGVPPRPACCVARVTNSPSPLARTFSARRAALGARARHPCASTRPPHGSARVPGCSSCTPRRWAATGLETQVKPPGRARLRRPGPRPGGARRVAKPCVYEGASQTPPYRVSTRQRTGHAWTVSFKPLASACRCTQPHSLVVACCAGARALRRRAPCASPGAMQASDRFNINSQLQHLQARGLWERIRHGRDVAVPCASTARVRSVAAG